MGQPIGVVCRARGCRDRLLCVALQVRPAEILVSRLSRDYRSNSRAASSATRLSSPDRRHAPRDYRWESVALPVYFRLNPHAREQERPTRARPGSKGARGKIADRTRESELPPAGVSPLPAEGTPGREIRIYQGRWN